MTDFEKREIPAAPELRPDLPDYLRKSRLRRWEASDYLLRAHDYQIAPATLARMASTGGGPDFQKIGRWPNYSPAALDRWVAARMTREAA
jgi:hypothetical protein